MRGAEPETIASLFDQLMLAPLYAFPAIGEHLTAPKQGGVYVIYSPAREVLHVGATPKARNGVAQRLRNHLSAQSSFVQRHLDGNGSQLRNGYMFRYLTVENRRFRALLEAYAIGHLCPAHIGHGNSVTTEQE
jgi:hypothetical protein